LDCLAQTGDEILIEHPHDYAHLRMDAPHHKGRRDVHEIVAGEYQDAARVGNARMFEDLMASAIAANQEHVLQPAVIFRAGVIDDDNGQAGRTEIFQDPRADSPKTAENDGFGIHFRLFAVGIQPLVPKELSIPRECVSCYDTKGFAIVLHTA
jgi:hypothetical protein